MSTPENAIREIGELDRAMMDRAQERLDSLTKPRGSLGRLEEIAKLIAGMTAQDSPSMEHKVIFTLAADHGVTQEGVSCYPAEVTAQMVYNFLRNGAGINVLARHVGARVVVADMGVASTLAIEKSAFTNFKDRKIAFGTKNFTAGPAMTRDEAARSLEAGIGLLEDELSAGIDIVGTGDMGIGNTTPSSAIAAAITGRPAAEVTGRGTGIGDTGLQKKVAAIEKALALNNPDPRDGIDVLSKVGGFEIGGLAGVIIGAASRRIPVVIDGFISGAAALIAFAIAPKTRDYMIASHCSVERGHRVILDHLGLKPILDLDLRLGEGTGAALGIGIVDASVKILKEMATFKEARVSEKDSQ